MGGCCRKQKNKCDLSDFDIEFTHVEKNKAFPLYKLSQPICLKSDKSCILYSPKGHNICPSCLYDRKRYNFLFGVTSVDLPPSYDTAVCNMPPTYREAVIQYYLQLRPDLSLTPEMEDSMFFTFGV